jgi:DNA-binding HxlR family transcriptional regulator
MWMHHREGLRVIEMAEIERYEDISWDMVSSIRASKRRTQVLRELDRNPKMNGELADELGISTPWVRRQVKWLEEHGLVKDLTKSKHNYKMYGVTEDGERILEVL